MLQMQKKIKAHRIKPLHRPERKPQVALLRQAFTFVSYLIGTRRTFAGLRGRTCATLSEKYNKIPMMFLYSQSSCKPRVGRMIRQGHPQSLRTPSTYSAPPVASTRMLYKRVTQWSAGPGIHARETKASVTKERAGWCTPVNSEKQVSKSSSFNHLLP